MPASTRRRTSSRSTCRRRWRRCACRPTPTTPGRRRSGALYQRNGLTLSLALAGGAGAVPGARRGAQRHRCWRRRSAGNFYAVFPHSLMVGAVRAGVPVRGAGAGDRRARASGATSAAAARLERRRRSAEADARRAAPEVPRRRPRRRLQRRRTMRFTLCAPALPPLHVLRLHAVLRRHLRGHALPLRVRLARAVRAAPACRCCWASSAASAC